jgi:plastocyanin
LIKRNLVSAIKFPPFIAFFAILIGLIVVQGYSMYISEGTEEVDLEIDISMSYIDRQHQFNPDNITLKSGMTVRFIFTNDGYVTHNFASQEQQSEGNDPGLLIRPGNPVTIIWTVPEDISELTNISYICTYHDGMNLDVLVEP